MSEVYANHWVLEEGMTDSGSGKTCRGGIFDQSLEDGCVGALEKY
jgi:hypothetical protein